MTFRFELQGIVEITASGECGSVIGRADYLMGEPTYLVRYKAADGRAVEAWWNDSALKSVE